MLSSDILVQVIQMRILPFGFTTVTILLTHPVCLLIFSSCSMGFSSSRTLGHRVTGTLRGGCKTGFEPGLSGK